MLFGSFTSDFGLYFFIALMAIGFVVERLLKAAAQNSHVQQGAANWFMSWFK